METSLWSLKTSPTASWTSVTYGKDGAGNGLFVAVSSSSSATNNLIMKSLDGINWSSFQSLAPIAWTSIAYGEDSSGNGLFVAVASQGTNRVMISPNGSDWTLITNPDVSLNTWRSVTCGKDSSGNRLFVAVSSNTFELDVNRIMISSDGINWTTFESQQRNFWSSVTYGKDEFGNGLFVAVSETGTNRVMTSPDGTNWTLQSVINTIPWRSVAYGNGRFVAVANSGQTRVMTSPDGINWGLQTITVQNAWSCVTYGEDSSGDGLFVVTSNTAGGSIGNRIMTSPDGLNWTIISSPLLAPWNSVTYGLDPSGNGVFVSVSSTGNSSVSGVRVMYATTLKPTLSEFPNIEATTTSLPFQLTPPSSNNTVGTFSYTSDDPSVATISGDTVTIQGAGISVITATKVLQLLLLLVQLVLNCWLHLPENWNQFMAHL